MWLYVENGQKAGPVNEQTLALLLSQGAINSSTLVWREGMTEWKQLGATELSESVLHQSPMNEIQGVTPRVNPKGLKTIFIWFLVSSIAYMVIFPVITLLVPTNFFSYFSSCLIYPISIAAAVLEYILLYKYWKITQDGFAKTSPGKAVGFSFIPVYNFYWIFIAIGSLAGELNHYILRQFKNDPSGLRRAHPVFAWIYIFFIFGSSCVSLFSFGQIFSTALSQTNYPSMPQEFIVRFSIILLVSMTLLMITFYDFYLTSKSIVDMESSQHLH